MSGAREYPRSVRVCARAVAIVFVAFLGCDRPSASTPSPVASATVDAAASAPEATPASTPDAAPSGAPLPPSVSKMGAPCQSAADCPEPLVCCKVYAGRALRQRCGKKGTRSNGAPYEDRAKPSNIVEVCE
jgi:hypothetical protein